jgi:hypothetical protein
VDGTPAGSHVSIKLSEGILVSLIELEIKDLDIFLDTLRGNGLWYNYEILFDQPAQHNLSWAFVVLFGNTGNDRIV